MAILITGVAGFIGSHFVEYLFENSQIENVIVVDKLTYAGTWENLNHIENRNSLDLIQGDINDDHLMDSIIKNVEYVVNFAAETHVDRSISNPKPFIISNVLGAQNIFDSCLKHNKRIVHISTDEVYGSYSYGKANESSKLNPSSPYSASKASADLIALSYFKTYGLNVSTAGKGITIKGGTNAKIGTASFAAQSTVTVSTTAVTANSLIFVTGQAGVDSFSVNNKVAGTSFDIVHDGGNTTTTVAWMIVEQG